MGDVLSLSFFVPGRPVPFARAGANGKRRFTPKKQAEFMGVVQIAAKRAMDVAGMRAPFEGAALEMRYQAVYEVPKAWTKAQRAAAAWKTSVPDTDNLYKLCSDAMNTVVFADDALVARSVIEKRYGDEQGTKITVSIIDGRDTADIKEAA